MNVAMGLSAMLKKSIIKFWLLMPYSHGISGPGLSLLVDFSVV